MAKLNIRESLSKRDLISDNKYDLRNTYDSLNLSESKKKQLAKALYENKSNRAIYSILNNKLNEDMFIDEFSRYSEEYEKLDRVSTFLTAMSPNKYYYYVGNTYFDFGQDWKWTTILAKTPRGDSYQALNPRQQEDILLAISDEELEEIAKQILKNSYVDKGFVQESFSTKNVVKSKSKSINEDTDIEDFDDSYDEDGVEEGNIFFADGKDYIWEERIAGPIHLDFDNWAVWSARESVNIFDYATEKPGGGYEVDKDAFMKAYMDAPVVYFVVDEDTGFIDWGPCDTDIEAKDFLNSKQDDWENDYFTESINSSTTYNIDDYSPKAMVDEITAKVKDPNVSFIKWYYKSRYGSGCTCFKRNGNSWSWVNDKGVVMNRGTVNEKNSLNLSDQYVLKQLVYSLRNNNCTKLVIDIRASADL